ncbi:MAG: bifunctional nuclease family protein [Deltaproteobacteria bacterium]|nr:bifunctional nuclease family protein [Deltaproteobacteria bacterium]
MMRPMFISQIALNALSGNAVVVLQEIGGTRALPIPIGPLEANAIASELEGIKPARPMTHDLLMNLLDATDVKVIKVDISDRKDDTYYALIHILHRGTERVIDARPSDALALSLRVRAPVFVAEKVMRKSMDGSQGGKRLSGSGDQRNWRDLLEDLDPDDLGSA